VLRLRAVTIRRSKPRRVFLRAAHRARLAFRASPRSPRAGGCRCILPRPLIRNGQTRLPVGCGIRTSPSRRRSASLGRKADAWDGPAFSRSGKLRAGAWVMSWLCCSLQMPHDSSPRDQGGDLLPVGLGGGRSWWAHRRSTPENTLANIEDFSTAPIAPVSGRFRNAQEISTSREGAGRRMPTGSNHRGGQTTQESLTD